MREQYSVHAVHSQPADVISGAGTEMIPTYNQRLTDLEPTGNFFAGVQSAYSIQAGREVRGLVENNRVIDQGAVALSREIAHKIDTEMAFPGQIKVIVIGATRIVQDAR